MRPEEESAAAIVARVLGAAVNPLDVPGAARRTPDCEVIHPDGRRGPLEVMRLTTTASEHLEHRLRAIGQKMPATGTHRWFANVRTVAELDRISANHVHLIQLLEQYGAHQWSDLPPWIVAADPELSWLSTSGASLTRELHPGSSPGPHPVYVFGPGYGAVWDAEADVVTPAVQQALTADGVVDHIEKLLAWPGDERHLFLIVDLAGIAPEAAHELMGVEKIPTGELRLPDGITHLWLLPRFGQRFLLWTAGAGWSVHEHEEQAS